MKIETERLNLIPCSAGFFENVILRKNQKSSHLKLSGEWLDPEFDSK